MQINPIVSLLLISQFCYENTILVYKTTLFSVLNTNRKAEFTTHNILKILRTSSQ